MNPSKLLASWISRCSSTNLRYHFGSFAKVGTPSHGVGLGEIIFDQTQADVVTHAVQLLVDLDVVALKILT